MEVDNRTSRQSQNLEILPFISLRKKTPFLTYLPTTPFYPKFRLGKQNQTIRQKLRNLLITLIETPYSYFLQNFGCLTWYLYSCK